MVPNMHIVVARYVKPMTRQCGKSYALMKRPAGIKISHFITHTWEESFADFVRTLQAALSAQDVVWVCSFALNQNADIEQAIGGELVDCPFAVALRHAVKQLVVLDRGLQVPRRSWCTYELSIACQFGIPTFLWPNRGSDIGRMEKDVDALDMRESKATKPEDEARIRSAIEASAGGFDRLNGRLRNVLRVTLRFHQEAAGQVAELSRMVEAAKRQGDAVRHNLLEEARQSELRRIENVEVARQRHSFLEDKYSALQREAESLRRRLASAEELASRGGAGEAARTQPASRRMAPLVGSAGCGWMSHGMKRIHRRKWHW